MHEVHSSIPMILRHLRYFTVVASQGSVAGAAKLLRVAQPALSRQIQRLEKVVGFPLLHRERRGVQLTSAGEVFRDGARTLLDDLTVTAQRARRTVTGEVGMLRLGLGRSPLHDGRVGAALEAVRAEYPDVECITVETLSFNQADALAAEEIDIGIGVALPRGSDDAGDSEPDVHSALLYVEPIDVALLPVNHPLASRRELRPADLRGERLITVDASITPMFGPALRELDRHGLLENSEPHARIETIWNLVAAGRGWTIAPATHLVAPPTGTAAVKIRGFNVEMPVVVRWRATDQSRLTSNVVSVIRRVVAGETRRLRRATPAAGVPVTTANALTAVVNTIEMRGLRALLAAVEEGSLSDAAKRLQLTQSAVSRQIRSLEQAVGVPLMVRDANGVSATPAGEIVATEAHRAIARFEHTLLQARRADRGFSGVCHVGSVPSELSHNIMLDVMRAMAERTPAIAMEVEEMLSPRQGAALRSGQIDVGLALSLPGLVNDRAIASMKVMEDALDCALLPATHPLATRAWLKPKELESLRFLFIARPVYPAFYDAVLQAFDQIGLHPPIDESHTGPHTLWRLIADGYGWALGPRSVRAKPITGLAAVPIEGLHLPSGLDLLWRRNETSQTVLAVLDAFRGASATAA
jgi:DNA-binding transcriptional LysR family regulator